MGDKWELKSEDKMIPPPMFLNLNGTPHCPNCVPSLTIENFYIMKVKNETTAIQAGK